MAGAVLGCVDTSRLELPDIPLPDGADFVHVPPDLIDGTEGIKQAAKQVSLSLLKEAVIIDVELLDAVPENIDPRIIKNLRVFRFSVYLFIDPVREN